MLKLVLLILVAQMSLAAHPNLTSGTMTLGGKFALEYKTPDLKTTWQIEQPVKNSNDEIMNIAWTRRLELSFRT